MFIFTISEVLCSFSNASTDEDSLSSRSNKYYNSKLYKKVTKLFNALEKKIIAKETRAKEVLEKNTRTPGLLFAYQQQSSGHILTVGNSVLSLLF